MALTLFAAHPHIAVELAVDVDAAVEGVRSLDIVALPEELLAEALALAVLAYVQEDHVAESLVHCEVGKSQD